MDYSARRPEQFEATPPIKERANVSSEVRCEVLGVERPSDDAPALPESRSDANLSAEPQSSPILPTPAATGAAAPTTTIVATKSEQTETRAIFVSDVHLGCKYARSEEFLKFLLSHQPPYLYLVGDFFDGWRLKKNWHWRDSYTAVVQRLIDLTRSGTQIFYTPGNHDEFLRDFLSFSNFGGISIANEFIHTTANGRRLLVTHGDQFDKVTSNHKWLSKLGDFGYNLLLAVDRGMNGVLGRMGVGNIALSKRVKEKVKRITNSVSKFEDTLAEFAVLRKCEGVVCGHIHIPEVIERPSGVSYYNTGDWVENQSALFELADGRLEIRQTA